MPDFFALVNHTQDCAYVASHAHLKMVQASIVQAEIIRRKALIIIIWRNLHKGSMADWPKRQVERH